MHLCGFMNIFHKVLEFWPGDESGTYGRTDVRTDGRTGRSGVTLYALPLFFEYAGGHNKACSCSLSANCDFDL